MFATAQDLFSTTVWIWFGVAAVLLAIELPTTTGWLLAPAACAVIMGGLNLLGFAPGWGWQLVIYAAATAALSLLFRWAMPRLFAGGRHATPDINDRAGSLLGKVGQTVGPFNNGSGRVLVDGAEWDAEVEFGLAPAAGDKVEVVRVLGGARLAVRPI